jgi:phosphohistidine phosphatase
MKILSVLRHAKTERPDKYDRDMERPLTKRGRRDARTMGRVVADVEPSVDWLISSPAVRTRQTVDELLRNLSLAQSVAWEDEVYNASADALLSLLSRTTSRAKHVLLVGHNPSVAELVAGLSAGSPQRLNLHMPTATLAHLHLEIFQWDQIRWGCGILRAFLPPKLIRGHLKG